MPNGLRRPIRILAAEDDMTEAFLVKRAFVKAGVKAPIDFVADGQEAIDWLEGNGTFSDRSTHPLPTLLLLDLKMPRADGFKVLEWLRKKPGLRRMVVIVFSNSDLLDDVNRSYELGANSYIKKPADLTQLEELAGQLDRYWLGRNELPEVAA